MENRRSLLLPPGPLFMQPHLDCHFRPHVVITRMINPNLRPSMAVYPPALARRSAENAHFIIRPPQQVPPNIFRAVHQGYPSEAASTSFGDFHGNTAVNRTQYYRRGDEAVDPELLNHRNLLAGHEQDSGTEGRNNQNRSRLLEHFTQFTRDCSPSHEEPQRDEPKIGDLGQWDTAINEGEFNPDSLLAGNEHQPLYIQQDSDSECENDYIGSLLAEYLLGDKTDSSSSPKELKARTKGTPEWLSSRLSSQRPTLSQDTPDMVLDCEETLAEVTVESTPSYEELQVHVNQMQWENTIGESYREQESLLVVDIPVSCPSRIGLETTIGNENNEMESLLEALPVETEQSAANNSLQQNTLDEDIDLFDTLGAIRRRGIRYQQLVKCPAPYCNKVGPYHGMDNHYMTFHANTAIVDEKPYYNFLRNS